jgi:predicted transposase YbfD/YdcC
VILAVFVGLDSWEFAVVFMQWAHLLRARLAEPGNHIAVDGNTIRGSRGGDGTMVHQVSAWLSGQGLVLGHRAMGEKRNEIQEIPELLHLLDLHGRKGTIDAIGCQTMITATIQERGGEYLLQVKPNHWVFDIAFREDRARHRNGTCAANFSLVRAFALNLIKQEKILKLGIANKRKRTGWHHCYLLKVLNGIPET